METTRPPLLPDGAADRRIARAFEDAPAVIAVHRGPEHTIVFVNRRFREAGDGRPLVGRTYADAFPEFVEQGFLALLDSVYATGTPFVANGTRADTPRIPGGVPEERYWNLTFQPTVGDDGRVDGVTSFAFEVTEHVRALRETDEAKQRYAGLVDALGVVVWCVDPTDWRPEWVRGKVQEVLGTADEAADPRAWLDRVHPADMERVRVARALLPEPGEHYRVEYRLGSESEGWRWFAESGQVQRDPGALRPLLWGLTQDVTERVVHQQERDRLQGQLLNVQRLESLGTLAGGVAHDFNNLLTAILGNASLAEMQLESGHPARRAVGALIAASARASDLTRQLLAFSGRGHFKLQAVDVNVQLRELMVLLEASVSKKVCLRLEAQEALPMIEADVSQLNQVLMNLVINAAEALDEQGGTVAVRTSVERLGAKDLTGPYSAIVALPDGSLVVSPQRADTKGPRTPAPAHRFVCIEVSDTGHGMSAETLARIFDPFFTTKVSGRGLGLAAVQGIIRGHKGTIRVYSELGRGTIFKVFLPAVDGLSPPSLPPVSRAERRKGTVLVVDDEPMVRTFARAVLEQHGHRVFEATDGVEGVAAFQRHAAEIDVVLLDLTMPRMGGEEALAQIRKMSARTPVVLSSGYNQVEATRRLLGRGAVEFLQKPYRAVDLIGLMDRLMPAR
jgi:signal transduction histidine kinase